MSDNAERSEQSGSTGGVKQITKAPSIAPKREKDPKRVAAGKKLAESNKRMREEHAKYKAMEAQRVTEAPAKAPETEHETETSGGFFSELSLSNVISLVGIGLTVYTIFFMRSRDNKSTNEKHVAWQEPVETTYEKPEAKPKIKFGM